MRINSKIFVLHLNMQTKMNQYFNRYIKIIGSPKIFVFTVMWMMVLIFIGTVVQKDIGLYAAQQQYFSSWINLFFGYIPLPSGKLTMFIMFLNLSCYFFRPHIFSQNKIGITITHSGVILMLIGGVLTSLFSTEGSLVIEEGGESNFFENYHLKEFIIVDTTNDEYDDFTVFNNDLLYQNNILNHDNFKIEILDFYANCRPEKRIYGGEETFQGMAKNFFLQELDPLKEYEKNISGIVYRLIGTESNDGIYINYIGQPITQSLNYLGQDYLLILRRERTYLPFSLHLIDFKKVLHPGTNIAKSYSSEVYLNENGISRKVLIQMNEPLRHRGYTFYQASFLEEGMKETTVLATVKNYGRLFPYISTIIMCIGLLTHMMLMLSRRFKNTSNPL